ncbi:MAG: phosphate ABC transporter permease PtsA, partial [Tardiphaga sp.]
MSAVDTAADIPANSVNPIYARRRRKDIVVRGLCVCAAVFGVTWLALILFTLFYNGLTG